MIPPFNWRHLLRQSFRSLFGTRGTHRRLSPHRLGVLAVFWTLFIPHQIVTHLCLVLDNLFFPKWRRTPVEKPLFITGLFRSGTTFLHRLLARDSGTFCTFKTWEIYLAPSILQRRLLKAGMAVDRRLGSPVLRWFKRYDSRSLGEVQFHKVGLWKEEEDEGLLLFLWDSLFTWFFFPDPAGIDDYLYADRDMSPRRRRRKFAFYRACVRRHLYAHPGSPVYLSKNPAFTPKLAGLREAFPDARVVYLVRDPLDVLVSQAAWFSFCWHYFASPTEPYPFRSELQDMTVHWYRHALAVLDRWEPHQHLVVEYRNLVDRPVDTIEGLYRHFGLEIDADFRARLEFESRRSDEYASGRRLGPEEVGYAPEEIRRELADVYARFDFAAED